MTAHLLLRRPPYKQEGQFSPPRDGFDILGTATEVLVRDMRLRIPDLAQWAWKSWVKWYALAIVLAELCVRPDGPQSDKAFAVAHDAYQLYAPRIADSDSGMLWKPIDKLMRRVQGLRATSKLDTQSIHTYTPSAPFTHRLSMTCVHRDNLSAAMSRTEHTLANVFPMPEAFSSGFHQGLPIVSPGSSTAIQYPDIHDGMDDMHIDKAWSNWDMFLDEFNNPLGFPNTNSWLI
jgi:hypothetical protein